MKKNKPLKIEFPSQGWKQFLTAKKEMLDSFDKAKELSKKRAVQTFHGNVAEGEFRKWLQNFLPKKYAVTSGYIISQGIPDSKNLPHFDVIIYEHLEAPTLWIENNPDSSDQGKSRAIPAEFVKSVIEVKSSFEKSTVNDAIQHLSKLKELLKGTDKNDERYKLYLPPDFFCSIAFFELREKNKKDFDALLGLNKGLELRGFYGGVILRGDGHEIDLTCKLQIIKGDNALFKSIEEVDSLLNSHAIIESKKLNEVISIGPSFSWSEMNFSEFSFDIIALLNGTYESGRLSSFYGIGTSGKIESKW